MPAQSYLANVPDSVAICTTEASLHTYRDLGANFSSGSVPGDPWSHGDFFGKTSFHKVSCFFQNTLEKQPKPITRSASSSSSSADGKQSKRSPCKSKKIVHFDRLSQLMPYNFRGTLIAALLKTKCT